MVELHPIRLRLPALYHKMRSPRYFTNISVDAEQSPTIRRASLHQRSPYPIFSYYKNFACGLTNGLTFCITITWPALPFTTCRSPSYMRRLGINWLTYTHVESPELSAVLYKNKTRDVKVIPALLIWREHATTDWLIFDKDELDLLGKFMSPILWSSNRQLLSLTHSKVILAMRTAVPKSTSTNRIRTGLATWSTIGSLLSMSSEYEVFPEGYGSTPDRFLPRLVAVIFNHSSNYALPTFPWSLRHTVLERTQYNYLLLFLCIKLD